MAIKLNCIELVTSVEVAKACFRPALLGGDCYSDGVICNPMGTMAASGVKDMVNHCNGLGLAPIGKSCHNGEMEGDYCIASHLGWEDDVVNACKSWLRVFRGVAWHKDYPMGVDVPSAFPCLWGGFYYESAERWRAAEGALLSLTEELPQLASLPEIDEDGLLIMKPLPAYFDFFDELGRRTLIHSMNA